MNLRWCFLFCLYGCGGGHSSSPATPPTFMPAPTPLTVGGPVAAPTNLDCASGSSLTYENFGESFVVSYCNMCHSSQVTGAARQGTPVGLDFDTISEVQLQRAPMLTDLAGGSSPMPPSWTVDAHDLSSATQWLKCGAPTAADKNHLP